MKKLLCAVTAGALLMFTSSPSYAWNARGHMIVATIAWDQMTPAARARASELLRLNPDYAVWVAGQPAELRDVVAFAQAATWPDDIRSGYIDDGYEPVEPHASQNIGYADRYVHRYWHYKNIPFSTDGTAMRPALEINAVSRISVFSAALGAPGVNDDVKSYDLVWLLHLVGDIHQPLHSVALFTEDLPNGDRGGNSINLCVNHCGNGRGDSNLHSFWDRALGTYDVPRAAVHAARAIQYRAPEGLARISDPNVWAGESSALAQRYAYAPLDGGRQPYRISQGYRTQAGYTAEAQAVLAGTRLARLMNEKLDPGSS